jgi:hydroxyacylglutathione hydrolase
VILNILNIVVGAFEVNCFIIASPDGYTLVIDPGADAIDIAKIISSKKLKISAYLLTHGHMDHISGLSELHALHPAPVYIHKSDLEWAYTEENAMPPFYSAPDKPVGLKTIDIQDKQDYSLDGLEFRVITTPGHTPGGVCYHFFGQKALFSGDTLFAGSVGRTDINGGNTKILAQSLKKLVTLPDDTVVYPGHGPKTTIATEKRTNYFLRGN